MMLTLFVVGVDSSLVNIILPKLQEVFSSSMSQITLLATVYVAILAALQLFFGRLADLFSSVRVFFLGVVLFFLGSLVCALSGTYAQLMVGRGLQGLGGAMLAASFGAVILQRFPKEKTGRIVGAAMTMMSVGSLVGPPLGGYLAQNISWHWAFAINLPLCVIACLLIWPSLESHESVLWRGRLDVPGAAISAFVFLAFPLGLHMTTGKGGHGLEGWALVGLAALGVWAFVVIERKAQEPLLQVGLFRNPALSLMAVIKILLFLLLNGVMLIFPFFITSQSGAEVGDAGWLMLCSALAMGLSTPWAGRMVDRIGTGRLLFRGALALSAVSLVAFALPPHPEFWMFAALLGGFGATVSVVLVSSSVAILRLAPVGQEGVFSALNSLMAPVGGALGLSLFSLLYGDGANRNHAFSGFRHSIVGIVVCALSIVFLAKANQTFQENDSA